MDERTYNGITAELTERYERQTFDTFIAFKEFNITDEAAALLTVATALNGEMRVLTGDL